MFEFTGELWRYEEPGGWYFVTLPQDISEDIHRIFSDLSPGFGSIPMKVTVGTSTWSTSAFYDTKIKRYLLPVKAAIRKKEDLKAGDCLMVCFDIIV